MIVYWWRPSCPYCRVSPHNLTCAHSSNAALTCAAGSSPRCAMFDSGILRALLTNRLCIGACHPSILRRGRPYTPQKPRGGLQTQGVSPEEGAVTCAKAKRRLAMLPRPALGSTRALPDALAAARRSASRTLLLCDFDKTLTDCDAGAHAMFSLGRALSSCMRCRSCSEVLLLGLAMACHPINNRA